MTKVGFTGTRFDWAITDIQKVWLAVELTKVIAENRLTKNQFHHGDCIGADALAAEMANEMGFYVVRHPPLNPKFWANTVADYSFPKRHYALRNRDIVNECEVLLALARGVETGYPRSGTWQTIRYAIKVGKPVKICLPEGELTNVRA